MWITDTIRVRPNGDPAPAGSLVTLTLVETGAVLGTVQTDAKGSFSFYTPGHPGDVEYSVTVGAEVKRHATRSVMPTGPVDLAALPAFFEAWTDGVVDRNGGALAVTASGTTLTVTVAAGLGMASGLLYYSKDAQTLTVPAAHATLPRRDLVALRFTLTGDNAGRSALVYLQGTADSTSPLPTLAQDATGWDGVLFEMPLAIVQVDAGVTAIATNKVADSRTFCSPQGVQTAIDVQEGGTSKAQATAIDFTGSDFDIAVSGGKPTVSVVRKPIPPPVNDYVPIGARLLNASVAGQSPVTITLAGNQSYQVKVRTTLRGYGQDGGGGPGRGRFRITINSNQGKWTEYVQFDGNVDREVTLIHLLPYIRFGANTNITTTWEYEQDYPGIQITGGWTEYDAIPYG